MGGFLQGLGFRFVFLVGGGGGGSGLGSEGSKVTQLLRACKGPMTLCVFFHGFGE